MSGKYDSIKPGQAKVLEELERLIGRTIPQVEEIKFSTFGVKLKGDIFVGLGLVNSGLTTLPDTIGQLSALQTLYIGGNQLRTVPDSLKQLTSLQILDLSRNQLKAVPDILEQLTTLRDLSLSRNQLKAVPVSLGQLRSLQILTLSHNELETVPDSLGQLTHLRELRLNDNKLISLPKAIYQLPKLTILKISGNPWSDIKPEVINRLMKNFSALEFIEDFLESRKLRVSLDQPTFETLLMEKLEDLFNEDKIQVFISYAEEDSARLHVPDLAEGLASQEEELIVHYWEGWNEYAGDIVDIIEKFMNASEIFIPICTKDYEKSYNCQKERKLATLLEKEIIPVFEELQYVPGVLRTSKGLNISHKKTPDIVKALYKMIKALYKMIKKRSIKLETKKI